jgi:LysM repeat protein
MMRAVWLFGLAVFWLAIGVSAAAAQQVYVVAPGDQLDRIGLRFGVTAECLAEINGIPDINLIYPGQVLLIRPCQPVVTVPPQPTQQPTPQPTPITPIPATYTVQPGDRLVDIAARLGLDAECLARANSLIYPNRIRVGQILTLGACRGQGGLTLIPTTYTIQPGDKLVDVANRFGLALDCLIRANALADQNRIQRGQTLRLDPCIAQGGGLAPLPTSQTYTVRPGDRLDNIAFMFGVDAACLARTNLLANPSAIRSGETLTIDYVACGAGAQPTTNPSGPFR